MRQRVSSMYSSCTCIVCVVRSQWGPFGRSDVRCVVFCVFLLLFSVGAIFVIILCVLCE
jgi:hypothetical protein